LSFPHSHSHSHSHSHTLTLTLTHEGLELVRKLGVLARHLRQGDGHVARMPTCRATQSRSSMDIHNTINPEYSKGFLAADRAFSLKSHFYSPGTPAQGVQPHCRLLTLSTSPPSLAPRACNKACTHHQRNLFRQRCACCNEAHQALFSPIMPDAVPLCPQQAARRPGTQPTWPHVVLRKSERRSSSVARNVWLYFFARTATAGEGGPGEGTGQHRGNERQE